MWSESVCCLTKKIAAICLLAWYISSSLLNIFSISFDERKWPMRHKNDKSWRCSAFGSRILQALVESAENASNDRPETPTQQKEWQKKGANISYLSFQSPHKFQRNFSVTKNQGVTNFFALCLKCSLAEKQRLFAKIPVYMHSTRKLVYPNQHWFFFQKTLIFRS